ncbi:MAG: tRNA pseudouridine(38-40) synthase TruA [Candidatus Omnitrophica bacterium CG23_combo_of_CG06-09_8_20_14_all_40_11]|nr:MAG: tRNA pseudouridine(38-40) synthase TruA [Candidatus Omnitrophica bacterium CG23_combo_of_CG06-09_8_20_14_all_40_11]
MRNIKLTIEYDGKNYAGWQTQNKKHKTIQQTLEKALQKILRKRIRIIGSGRTDAGVHAQAQVANFKTDSNIAIEKLQKALNAVLPDDIAVIETEEVGLNFHSRFSAKSKVYRYTILNRPSRSAILRDTAYFFPYPLNLKLMRKDARILLGRHNFKSFQAADKKERGAVRTIKNFKVIRDKDFIYIDIESDGFLYNMVRNIVGTLIEIGRGKFPEGSLRKILESRNRKLAGPTVPARGLSLIKVNY